MRPVCPLHSKGVSVSSVPISSFETAGRATEAKHCHRYITSVSTIEYISKKGSVINSACSCLSYLCQQHHDPELNEEEVEAYALAGGYVFHEYATTYWLELVERSIQLDDKEKTISDNIIKHLELLGEVRLNGNFEKMPKASTSSTASLASEWPSLHEMMGKAVQFRQDSLNSQYQL